LAEIRYQSNRPTYRDFINVTNGALTQAIQHQRAIQAKLPPGEVQKVMRPVKLESLGLTVKTADGPIKEDSEGRNVAAAPVVPGGLMMLMFMMVLMGATPLMQGVVEEKMQRIAEVLLGSISPFGLMLGKIAGMTAVSLTIALVYLSGGYWLVHRFDLAGSLPI